MELYTLDSQFHKTAYVEATESTIWSLRYSEYGDFEIHIPYFSDLTAYLITAAYILDEETRTAMFVEDVEISTDSEDGPMVIFKGRSLESILSRRIVWRKKTIKGNIQNVIAGLIDENIVNPTPETERKISNFVFQASTDERLAGNNAYKIDEHSPIELLGDNLYDIIKELCDLYDIGFRVTLNSQNQFVFQLYCGEALDGSEDTKKKVTFSPKMDNLSNSRYYQSTQNYKNVTRIVSVYEFKAEQNNDKDDEDATTVVTASTPSWVVAPRSASELADFAGTKITIHFNKKLAANATMNLNNTGAKPLWYKDHRIRDEEIDSGTEMVMVYQTTGGGRWLLTAIKEGDPPIEQTRVLLYPDPDDAYYSGLERREIFTDANSITTEDGMTPSDYAESMRIQGYGTLRDNREETEVDGESIPGIHYTFGEDYQLGDIVFVENECGISVSVRVIEYVQTCDENGISACPTFSSAYS